MSDTKRARQETDESENSEAEESDSDFRNLSEIVDDSDAVCQSWQIVKILEFLFDLKHKNVPGVTPRLMYDAMDKYEAGEMCVKNVYKRDPEKSSHIYIFDGDDVTEYVYDKETFTKLNYRTE